MSTTSTVQRITLAVERPELEATARSFCCAFSADMPVTVVSLDAFSDLLDAPHQPEELLVLLLHADDDGHLDSGAPILQRVMQSSTPVLVLRQLPGAASPSADLRRIVVPLDGSPVSGQAVPVASRVARFLGIPVKFVMVIDPSRVIPPAYAYDPEAFGMIEELRHMSHWALCQAEESLRNDGVEVTSDLLFGPINASLCASIGEGDLVVMTTHGLDRHGLRYRDSVALRTLVTIPQPMLIRQADPQSPVVVDGYQACSWAEPLRREPAGMA